MALMCMDEAFGGVVSTILHGILTPHFEMIGGATNVHTCAALVVVLLLTMKFLGAFSYLEIGQTTEMRNVSHRLAFEVRSSYLPLSLRLLHRMLPTQYLLDLRRLAVHVSVSV